MYKYTHTCIYTHIYMSAHIHTYTYIHTHIQNVYINTRKHAWNDGASANVQGAVADQGSFALLFRSTQSTHISHLQCKDFIVPTSCSTNTPPAVQQSRSMRARRNPSPRMIRVTVQEKRRVDFSQWVANRNCGGCDLSHRSFYPSPHHDVDAAPYLPIGSPYLTALLV